jgi:hypothetical protein
LNLRDSRFRHAHYLIGDSIGFSLVHITWLADLQFRLNGLANCPVADRVLELVEDWLLSYGIEF